MTRLGDFLSFLGTIFLTTVTQIFGNFLASFEIHHFLIQHLVTLVALEVGYRLLGLLAAPIYVSIERFV